MHSKPLLTVVSCWRTGCVMVLLAAAPAGRHGLAAATTAVPPSFERDVMAVLAKAGCNAGTCHGNLHGKGGLLLSLRGQDPEADWSTLVEGAAGRRINPIEPEKSLLLLKATAAVPHGGGRRFSPDALEYSFLRDWIAAGAARPRQDAPRVIRLMVEPADAILEGTTATQPLRVMAGFSDGSEADVTRLSVFEPADPTLPISTAGIVNAERPLTTTISVRYLGGQATARLAVIPPRSQASWQSPTPANVIDEEIFGRLRKLGLEPAPPANDLVFFRRIHLDLLGILPTAGAAQAFAEDTASDKKLRLIDSLLARPEWAAVWATIWSDLLRSEEKTLDAKGVEVFHAWLRRCFQDNMPLDQMVRQLVTARGSTYSTPPANFWRAHREVDVRAETAAQVFLGVRLQCARCHNHPFDRWLQDEYHDWSAVFTGIDYEIVKNDRKDKLDKHEFVGEQIIVIGALQPVKNPRTGKPAVPRLLDGTAPAMGDRLEALADWITDPAHRRFARTQVNRIWYHVMGRGLVDPIDDLRDTNPASHPRLLEMLTDEFIASGHDVRRLVRTICTAHTYGLASWHETDHPLAADESLYARAIVRRLSAERILDAQSQVVGIPCRFEGYPTGTRAGDVAGVERLRRRAAAGDRFLRLFGKPERLLACECERSNSPTLAQALELVGGEDLDARLGADDNRLGALLAADRSPEAIIDELFWTALTRPPTPAERAELVRSFTEAAEPRVVLEDLTWALLNSKEFLFRN